MRHSSSSASPRPARSRLPSQLALVPTGQLTVIEELGAEQVALVPALEVFTEQLGSARNRLAIPQGSEIDGILSGALVPAFEGTVSVRDALADAAAQIDALLQQQ